jgi:hypothetical protein
LASIAENPLFAKSAQGNCAAHFLFHSTVVEWQYSKDFPGLAPPFAATAKKWRKFVEPRLMYL